MARLRASRIFTRSSPSASRERHSGSWCRTWPTAVVIADPAGTIVFWNAAATVLFGWSEDEAVGRSLDLIVPEQLRGAPGPATDTSWRPDAPTTGGRLLEGVPALPIADGHSSPSPSPSRSSTEPGDQRPDAIAAVLRDDATRREEVIALRRRIPAVARGVGGIARSAGIGSPHCSGRGSPSSESLPGTRWLRRPPTAKRVRTLSTPSFDHARAAGAKPARSQEVIDAHRLPQDLSGRDPRR